MKSETTGFCLDFRRIASRRVSGNIWSLLLELVGQPLVIAVLVFVAFIHRDAVNPYRLNFLYFSTLYAFWIGLFGACQAINSEMKSGEWCYWVLGMGRNRTVHILATFLSCLLFAFIQCLVFVLLVVGLSVVADMPCNHFVDMFVSIPGALNGMTSPDPIYQMNGALWYVLSAKWGALGPVFFATSIFGVALLSALVTGTSFGLFFGAFFREPATSLNMAVGFVVILGMVSLCGLKGDGEKEVDVLFAPLRDRTIVREPMMKREHFDFNAKPAASVSYALPQRYFFNIGRITFEKDWSRDKKVQSTLRETFLGDNNRSNSRYKAYWMKTGDSINFDVANGIAKWINGWGCDYPSDSDGEGFEDCGQPTPCELVHFLRRHPEHRRGWNIALYRKQLFSTVWLELLPLLFFNILCLGGTLLVVWNKSCYQQLR